MRKHLITLALASAVAGALLAVPGVAGVPVGQGGVRAEAATLSSAQINKALTDARVDKVSRFGFKTLAQVSKGKNRNTFVSPISILTALGMAENGASGNTLKEMRAATGMSVKSLNRFVRAYNARLAKTTGKAVKVSSANAAWVNTASHCKVRSAYTGKLKKLYGAQVFKEAFSGNTPGTINNWISEKTDGMIDNVVGELPEDSPAILVNALAFDAKWAHPYTTDDVWKNAFTNANGTKSKVKCMHGEEHLYLSDSKARGFVKPYKNGKYCFVALLPRKGVTVNKCLSELSKKGLREMVKNASSEKVITTIPKFKYDYKTSLKKVLKRFGVEDAFSEDDANFKKMATMPPGWNVSLEDILHATRIVVDEKGTKAAAATVVIPKATGMAPGAKKPKVVRLTRPFVYAIVDAKTSTPLFAGVVKKL